MKHIKKIRIAAYIGLFGSLAVALGSILFVYLGKYRFYMDNGSFRVFMMVGCAIAVLDVALVLLTLRKRIPKLRGVDDVENKLSGYAALMGSLYYVTLVCCVILCAIIVLSYNSRLIMFLLLLVLMLFLCFPNMYRMKVDLGLDDEQMVALFGKDYIPDADSEPQEAEVVEDEESSEAEVK